MTFRHSAPWSSLSLVAACRRASRRLPRRSRRATLYAGARHASAPFATTQRSADAAPDLRPPSPLTRTSCASYPASGYADNALWQAADLPGWRAIVRPRPPIADARSRLLKQLQSGSPSSSLRPGRRHGAGDARPRQGREARGAAPLWRAPPTASSRRAVTPRREAAEPADASDASRNGRGRAASDYPDASAGRRPHQHRNGRRVDLHARAAREPAARVLRYTGRVSVARAASTRPSSSPTTSSARFALAASANTTRVVMDMEGVEATASSRSTTRSALIVDFKGLPRRRRRCPRCGAARLLSRRADDRSSAGRPSRSLPPPAPSVAGATSRSPPPLPSRPVRSADASAADRAARELEWPVLAGAAARTRRFTHRASTPATAATIPARAATASTNPSSCSMSRCG